MFTRQMFKSCDYTSLSSGKVTCSYCTVRMGSPSSCSYVSCGKVASSKYILVLYRMWSPSFLCNHAVPSCDLYLKWKKMRLWYLRWFVQGSEGFRWVKIRYRIGANQVQGGSKNGKMKINENCKGSFELHWMQIQAGGTSGRKLRKSKHIEYGQLTTSAVTTVFNK